MPSLYHDNFVLSISDGFEVRSKVMSYLKHYSNVLGTSIGWLYKQKKKRKGLYLCYGNSVSMTSLSHFLFHFYLLQVAQGVKNPPAVLETQETYPVLSCSILSCSIPGLIPWRRKWQPTPVFLTGEPHGPRSLAVYSPWGHKESDTTEVTMSPSTTDLQLNAGKTWVSAHQLTESSVRQLWYGLTPPFLRDCPGAQLLGHKQSEGYISDYSEKGLK